MTSLRSLIDRATIAGPLEVHPRNVVPVNGLVRVRGRCMEDQRVIDFLGKFGTYVTGHLYVLDDDQKTAVISQRGMGAALGLGKLGGRIPRFVKGESAPSGAMTRVATMGPAPEAAAVRAARSARAASRAATRASHRARPATSARVVRAMACAQPMWTRSRGCDGDRH